VAYLYYKEPLAMPDVISVRLPADLAKRLDALARDRERPRTFIIRKALESYLSETQDYQIALERLRDPDDEVISANDVRRVLGG
jgi:RHH-type transcriptional regulator, rel operon repressor / antitoxin RelB